MLAGHRGFISGRCGCAQWIVFSHLTFLFFLLWHCCFERKDTVIAGSSESRRAIALLGLLNKRFFRAMLLLYLPHPPHFSFLRLSSNASAFERYKSKQVLRTSRLPSPPTMTTLPHSPVCKQQRSEVLAELQDKRKLPR